MASFDGLDQAVSADAPCGPDPELDPDIQNFLLEVEAQLPASYRDFNKKAFDPRPVLKRLGDLLSGSRDVRYLVLSAKYLILSDNLQGFGDALEAIQSLLAAQWDNVHPTESAGGTPLRAAYIQSLDDMPTAVLPLQNAALHNDKRLGTITWRSVMVANQKVPARPDETTADPQALREAFARIEPFEHLQAIHVQVARVGTSLAAIRQIFIDKAGYENAPQFDKLPELANEIATYLAVIVNERKPAEVAPEALVEDGEAGDTAEPTETGASAPSAKAGDLTSVTDASSALQAILGYYASKEPSSPARLLVTQAHQLVGKSFIEAMQILAPALAERAKISIGGDAPFTLNFEQLAALAGGTASAEVAAAEPRAFTVATRADATSLMRKVEQFYRATEPSSPIPLLVEQARNFVAKDFAALMKEMAKPRANDD